MKRRALLASIPTVTLTARCSALPTGTDIDDAITDRSFRRVEGELIPDDSDEPPVVIFRDDVLRVVVFGTMAKGNPCMEAHLADASYDRPTDTLSVTVGVREKPIWERASAVPTAWGW